MPERHRAGWAGMSSLQNGISSIELDQKSIVRWNPKIQHERDVAIFDLLESNHFVPVIGGALLLGAAALIFLIIQKSRDKARADNGPPALDEGAPSGPPPLT